jgi:two-component system, NarL family, sensor kinase
MANRFPFQIIEGFRGATRGDEPSISSGVTSDENHILQIIGEATDNNLSLVLEACQKRLDALLEDRNRIGRHLQDCVLQPLFAITSKLASHRQACTDLPSDTSCSRDQSLLQLAKLIQEIRRVIRNLEEGSVQEFDLMSERRSMIDCYEPLGELAIELIIQSHVLQLLTQEEKREVFNITREAVNNCVRHAQATRAIIKLNHSGAKIRLAIMDNGTGFCPGHTRSHGYGLPNIETRVRKLGGQLHVRSRKGRGTKIVAEFPLEPIMTSA